MIDRVNKKECCQCHNCEIVCPVSAIMFKMGDELFSYPSIDEDKCVNCNRCEIVCPVINPLEQQVVLQSYGIKNKDLTVQKNSSSGGLFTALAQSIIIDGGYVFGAAWQENFLVKHIVINDMKGLSKLRGSKYVQSDLGDTFRKIKKILSEEKKVLFSGTPCQCAALRTFLGKRYDGFLYVVDFICHGILSEKLFEEYIEYLQKKGKSNIKSFEFREKTDGWLDSGPKIVYENGKVKKWPLYEDIYMQGYFQGICMRESCYQCLYKNFHSGSDITMGDYWGADILEPEFYDKMGVSLCCIQTENGLRLFEQSKANLVCKEVSLDKLTKYNQGLLEAFKKGEKSERYYILAEEKGYMEALKEVTCISKIEKAKRLYRKIRRKAMKVLPL